MPDRMQDKVIVPERQLELIAAAKAVRLKAYAPYSGFAVGAAILLDNGEIVAGCNVENSSYGISMCAERNAMAAAVANGGGNPVAVAVVGDEGRLCPPCGACRQFLAEFNPQMTIVLEDNAGLAIYTLEDLLPVYFSLEEGKRHGK